VDAIILALRWGMYNSPATIIPQSMGRCRGGDGEGKKEEGKKRKVKKRKTESCAHVARLFAPWRGLRDY
jgi:hypothetical protein